MNTYNFFAGPAILPYEVLKQAGSAVESFENMDLSILEISHRSKPFVEVMEKAENGVRTLLNISDEYAVLFLTGGASSQFYMAPMNILNENETAGYVDTGTWSAKAIKEAKLFGHVEILASSKDKNYNYIPKAYDIPSNLKYLHLTSNNTIFGTQFKQWPDTHIPLVCDMSSDIFSRNFDINQFDIVYAGAQKNIGPAGVTLVIVKKEILNKVERKIPTMLKYQTHIDKASSFNTPPVFPIYVSMLSIEWLIKNGGVDAIESINNEKAQLLYNEIDRNPLFKGTVVPEDRSTMNVCFLPNQEEHQKLFNSFSTDAGCVGLNGHRSVGGFRASIYNAMPKTGVEKLVEVMKDFEAKYG